MTDADFMRQAIALAENSIRNGGGPFGAVITQDAQVIASGHNQVTTNHDPTAHAEVQAIRQACLVLGRYSLEGCTIYTSCEPCPMCLGAIYWARLDRMVYANDRNDAAAIGFDDRALYDELLKPLAEQSIPTTRLLAEEAKATFDAWHQKADKTPY